MRISKKPKLQVTQDEIDVLRRLSVSRTESHQVVLRANILLKYYKDKTVTEIAKEMQKVRSLVELCINKALSNGVMQGLSDLHGRGLKPTITDDAKNWVLSVACIKPTDYNYSYETWTYRLLTEHIRTHCVSAGYDSFQKLGKSGLHGILSKANIKPHKIRYYLEKRNEEFDSKMVNVLQSYKEVSLIS